MNNFRYRQTVARPSLRRGTFLLLFCLLFVSACSGEEKPAARKKSAPLPVKIASVQQRDVPVELQAVGLVEAAATVAIKSRVTGTLTHVGFSEGEQVKAGQLLFQIDARPYAARRQQAEAIVAKDLAALDHAKQQLQRYEPAAKQGFATVEQAEQARTNLLSLQAQLQADRAALEQARIDLEHCTIVAPLSAQAGELGVDIGNLIDAGDQTLVTLNQMAPVEVSFTLPEQNLAELRKQQASGPMSVSIPVGEQTRTGQLIFIDNAIDRSSGTIRLKASLANQQREFWPGQFVDVKLRLRTRANALLVPKSAVQSGQQGNYVYLLKEDQTVVAREVVVAFNYADSSVIDSGLNAGEQVVTDGQLRLRDGAKVKLISTEPANR